MISDYTDDNIQDDDQDNWFNEQDDEFNEKYTDNSIIFSCSIGLILHGELAVKKISNIVSIGNSPYQLVYFIEKYCEEYEPKIKTWYIPFSGNTPMLENFDINNPMLAINDFLLENQTKIDDLTKNTSIIEIIEKSLTEKIAIVDYISTGLGIIAFYIMIIICLIYNKCGSKFDNKCQETIKTSLNNILIYCITDSESYVYMRNFVNFNSIFKIFDVNFYNNIYIGDYLKDNLIMEPVEVRDARYSFINQLSDDFARCMPSYNLKKWPYYKEAIEEYNNNINFKKMCEKIKTKIGQFIVDKMDDIIYFHEKMSKAKSFKQLSLLVTSKYDNNNNLFGGKYYKKYLIYKKKYLQLKYS